MTHRTQGKCYTYYYSFITAKDTYHIQPKGRDLKGQVWGFQAQYFSCPFPEESGHVTLPAQPHMTIIYCHLAEFTPVLSSIFNPVSVQRNGWLNHRSHDWTQPLVPLSSSGLRWCHLAKNPDPLITLSVFLAWPTRVILLA